MTLTRIAYFALAASAIGISSALAGCNQKPTMRYVGVKLINDQCITTWADDRGETYYEGSEPILSNGKKECAGG